MLRYSTASNHISEQNSYCWRPAASCVDNDLRPCGALLIEVNPIQEPELQRYPARVEKFCSNIVIRKLLGDITVQFVEATVERMFNSYEVTSVVDLAKLERLKRRIVSLFFTQ